eukprot:Opistho-2@69055
MATVSTRGGVDGGASESLSCAHTPAASPASSVPLQSTQTTQTTQTAPGKPAEVCTFSLNCRCGLSRKDHLVRQFEGYSAFMSARLSLQSKLGPQPPHLEGSVPATAIMQQQAVSVAAPAQQSIGKAAWPAIEHFLTSTYGVQKFCIVCGTENGRATAVGTTATPTATQAANSAANAASPTTNTGDDTAVAASAAVSSVAPVTGVSASPMYSALI